MTAVDIANPDDAADPVASSRHGATGLGDAELLRRHLAGDRLAFDALVSRHADHAWAVAISMLRDREEAADAVQDAMLSAFGAASTFRGASSVSTWLHRIVVTTCLDRMRRQASRPTATLTDAEERTRAAPGDAMAAREDRMILQAALACLPDAQRAALVLVDVEERPVAEVAQLLCLPVGTVRSHCARARARLAATLGYVRHGNPMALPSVSQGEWVGSPGHASGASEEVVGGEF
jgi:RNA polymerase sigma-70 factor, ECF subfamily